MPGNRKLPNTVSDVIDRHSPPLPRSQPLLYTHIVGVTHSPLSVSSCRQPPMCAKRRQLIWRLPPTGGLWGCSDPALSLVRAFSTQRSEPVMAGALRDLREAHATSPMHHPQRIALVLCNICSAKTHPPHPLNSPIARS